VKYINTSYEQVPRAKNHPTISPEIQDPQRSTPRNPRSTKSHHPEIQDPPRSTTRNPRSTNIHPKEIQDPPRSTTRNPRSTKIHPQKIQDPPRSTTKKSKIHYDPPPRNQRSLWIFVDLCGSWIAGGGSWWILDFWVMDRGGSRISGWWILVDGAPVDRSGLIVGCFCLLKASCSAVFVGISPYYSTTTQY